jgi:hypothetical protein
MGYEQLVTYNFQKDIIDQIKFPSADIGRGPLFSTDEGRRLASIRAAVMGHLPSSDEGAVLVGISASAKAAEMALLGLSMLRRQGIAIPDREFSMLKTTLSMQYINGGIVPNGDYAPFQKVDAFIKEVNTVLDKVLGEDRVLS